MWQSRGNIAKQSILRIDVPCQWLSIKIYPHIRCCVDMIISLNVYCICTDADNTAINNIYFYSLLTIDKMKENNQQNEILNN